MHEGRTSQQQNQLYYTQRQQWNNRLIIDCLWRNLILFFDFTFSSSYCLSLTYIIVQHFQLIVLYLSLLLFPSLTYIIVQQRSLSLLLFLSLTYIIVQQRSPHHQEASISLLNHAFHIGRIALHNTNLKPHQCWRATMCISIKFYVKRMHYKSL